MNKNIYLIV